MNNLQTQKGIVDSLFAVLENSADLEMGQRISQLTDEQPQIMGFLFNLDEDFSETEHSYILKSAIVVRDVFISAGIPFDMVNTTKVEEIINEKVEIYNKLAESEKTNTLKSWIEKSDSPVLYESVLSHNPAKTDVEQNLALIIDIIISFFEEATADTSKDKG